MPFGTQVVVAADGSVVNSRSEIVIGEHPVDLLGHRPVEAAKAGLDVGDLHAELGGDQRAGHRGVDVSDHEDHVGVPLESTGSKAAMIAAVCCAWLPEPTLRLMSGAGMPSSLEEDLRHPLVVVLARVDDCGGEASGDFRSSATIGATFMKLGRAPTMLMNLERCGHVRS